jgi:radical SAM protein with 4Fe4S-binding SPASM domain
MGPLLFRARLLPKSFVRNFGQIGIIYNTETRRQEVFDASGAIFLAQIGRVFKSGEEIVRSLLTSFTGTSTKELGQDFVDFANYLHQEAFIELEGSLAHDIADSSNRIKPHISKDRGLAETSEFLKVYFNTHPTLLSFQLYATQRCNERCVHCYVDQKASGRLLPLERRLDLIDQLQAMGTLDITFTGGEAFLDRDLPKLIERARKNDLVVAILSNLTLLTRELLEVIREAEVEIVQTSVYSMDADVHDSITRVPGSHRKTCLAIELLQSASVPVSVSVPILKENRDSFHEVLRYCQDGGIPVHCDVGIMAKENGDASNLSHRLGSSDFRDVVSKIVQHSATYRDLLEEHQDSADEVWMETCGIGNYMLCLKANGEFVPCPGFGLTVGNAWTSDLKDVWNNSPQLNAMRQFNRSSSFPQCKSCQSSAFCNFCLAKFHNETGWTSGLVPAAFCEIAQVNKQVALQHLGGLISAQRGA